jgi:hypothetical protein
MHSKFIRWIGCGFALIVCQGAQAAEMAPTGNASRPTAPLFTEDFESGKIDPARWTELITGDNSLVVQSARAAHGRFALRVHCTTPTSKTWAFIATNRVPESLRKHHFGRAYLFITPKLPTRHTILLHAGTGGFPFNRFQEVAWGSKGIFQLTYVELKPTGDNEDYHFGGEIPLGRWFCLEWEFNDEPNRATVWVDGQPAGDTGFVSKISGGSTNLVGGFTDFLFGFRLWGTPPESFDIYYDDIALDVTRIGPLEEKAKITPAP